MSAATIRRLEATARHHEKMARIFREYGNEDAARSAERAARMCREEIAA